ncbi:MAG: hypothetical protein KDB27_09370 [Planctomycetales bacterium]|nr:hypothetical protein [Planctomycetales bacterium]
MRRVLSDTDFDSFDDNVITLPFSTTFDETIGPELTCSLTSDCGVQASTIETTALEVASSDSAEFSTAGVVAALAIGSIILWGVFTWLMMFPAVSHSLWSIHELAPPAPFEDLYEIELSSNQ